MRSSRVLAAGFVAAQLSGAVCSLSLWLIMAQLVDETAQFEAISAYAQGTVLGLVLTLGLPAVMPTLVLRAEGNATGLRKSVWVVAAVATTTFCLSLILFILEIGSAVPMAGLYGACLAVGLLLAQLGRIKRYLSAICLAQAGLVVFPAAWLVALIHLGERDGRIFVPSSLSIVLIVLLAALFRIVGTPTASSSPEWWRLSTPLVPHMLFFSAILQGPRLQTTWWGTPDDVLDVHVPMLFANGTATVVAAVCTLWSTEMQMLGAEAYKRERKSRLAKLGLFALLFTTASQVVTYAAAYIGLVELTPSSILALASIAYLLVGYYALSATAIRRGKTVWFPVISGCAVLGVTLLSGFTSLGYWQSFLIGLNLLLAGNAAATWGYARIEVKLVGIYLVLPALATSSLLGAVVASPL